MQKFRFYFAGYFPVCPKTGIFSKLQTTFTHILILSGFLHYKFLDHGWTKFY